MRGFPVVLVGVVLAGVLGGCAGSVDGGAEPFVDLELPPRPREVPVQGVDPCALLTETQRMEIGLESPPRFTLNERSPLFAGSERTCSSRAFDPRSFSVIVGVSHDGLGVTGVTGRPVQADLAVIEVQGFPAVVVRPVADQLLCDVVVDLGPQQALAVQVRDGGRRNIPQGDLCSGAIDAAEAAMSTLLSQP